MPRIVLTCLLLLTASPAHAMHISEGILPLPWAALWFGVAAPFVVLVVRQLCTVCGELLA